MQKLMADLKVAKNQVTSLTAGNKGKRKSKSPAEESSIPPAVAALYEPIKDYAKRFGLTVRPWLKAAAVEKRTIRPSIDISSADIWVASRGTFKSAEIETLVQAAQVFDALSASPTLLKYFGKVVWVGETVSDRQNNLVQSINHFLH